MKKNGLILIILIGACSAFTQTNYTISGYVTDQSNKETLIGVSIFVASQNVGTTSNEYGFYSLSLPRGKHEIDFSYIGFENVVQTVQLEENLKLDIELPTNATQLEEVVVSSKAKNSNVSSTEMSIAKLDIATIKQIPTLLGEVEVIRSLQLLPGVSTVGEGALGFNVRGGGVDQNLILLDEAPVFNSSHLFGFYSVFNPDAIKDVKLYKGGIPARYGGRLSSILDVRMKEGNKKQLNINGGIGLIFSRLSVEAPIIEDKASFIVAGRRSYIDVLAQPFLNESFNDAALNFYDLTVKTNWEINDKNKVFLSGYTGRDNFGLGSQGGFNWGNQTATFRWNHLFSNKLFSNITLYYSNFDLTADFGDTQEDSFEWESSIQNFSVKPEFTLFINPQNTLRFGGQSIFYDFEPSQVIGVSDGEVQDLSIANKRAVESAIYIENEQTIGQQWSLNYGLRWSLFQQVGAGNAYTFQETELGVRPELASVETFGSGEVIQTYNNFEPRLSVKYQLNDRQSVKLSYNRTAQYIHQLSNTIATTPVDVWTPSTNNIKPQVSNQIALGYFQNFLNNRYEFSAETYFKTSDDLIDFIEGADLLVNELIEGEVLAGDGRAYGLELALKKTAGRITGWLGYTLARTELKVNGINNNEWYPARFDQTHKINFTGSYNLNKRIAFNANFVFVSGTPTTFPTTRIIQQGLIIAQNLDESRNNIHIPAYHRLDLSMSIQGKKNESRRWQGEWVFGIYNVYNRRNPFSIFTRQTDAVTTEAVRLSVIGSLIPSVSYNFKF